MASAKTVAATVAPIVSDADGVGDRMELEIRRHDSAPATGTQDTLSSIRTTIEFGFNAANGVNYRIEASTDLDAWSTVETDIIGQGEVVTRLFSTENLPRRFFRVRRN